MTKAQCEIRRRKIRQRIINRSTRRLIIANAIVILLIVIATLHSVTSSMEKVQVTNTNEAKKAKLRMQSQLRWRNIHLNQASIRRLHTQKIGMLKIVICLQELQWQKPKDVTLKPKH